MTDQTSREPSRANARGSVITVRSDDESIALLQLAARWAEAFDAGEPTGLQGAVERLRFAFEYLDGVRHGLHPVDTDTNRSR